MTDSYKNPFSAVNAVQLEPESILEYWCSPFPYEFFAPITEADIYKEPINLVFMGGRSTGKSMFLRYWSYPVQKLAAEQEGIKFTDILDRNRGVGIYVRIDGPMLKSFQGKGLSDEHWSAVFTHYFELYVGRQYIEVLKILEDEKSIDNSIITPRFLPKVSRLLGFPLQTTLDDLLEEFDAEIAHVDEFRGNVPFFREPFVPRRRGYDSESITFNLAELIKSEIPLFRDLNIII